MVPNTRGQAAVGSDLVCLQHRREEILQSASYRCLETPLNFHLPADKGKVFHESLNHLVYRVPGYVRKISLHASCTIDL